MADSHDPRDGGDPQRPVPRYGEQAYRASDSGSTGAAGDTGADPRHGSPWNPNDTQPIPPASQNGHNGYGSGSADGQAGGYGGGYDGASFQGGSAAHPGEGGTKTRRKFSAGAMVAGMALAGLLGAGTAVGTGAVAGGSSSSTSANSSPVIVNNTDSVNEITGATQKASPSVVTISATSGSEAGTGSGVVLDDQGHILTNTHVVTLDGATSNANLEVQTADGSVRKATVVGTDPESDLAVIKVDPSGLTPAEFADSSKLNVGDVAIAIGAPLGLSGTATDGIVSTLNRTIAVASSAAQETPEDSQQGGGGQDFFFNFPDNGQSGSQSAKSSVYLNVLQTDAAINPGNSGGALVNSSGQVIGINVAIASAAGSSSNDSSSSGNIGVGFSIPSNTAKRVADEIIKDGKATHGYLGASVSSYTPSGSNSGQFSSGALVRSVESGSPAADAGLKANDVVTKFNGKSITDADALTAGVRELAAGSQAELTFRRGNDEKTVTVTVGNAADHTSN
ncbi:MAG: trypsin-like peptidase domain-containing protein [Kocuria rhizophila]|nr:trypsin-like peptidase domain-containing protein [Kocuria rhizophila]